MNRRTKRILIQVTVWLALSVGILLLMLPLLPMPYAIIRATGIMAMIATVHYINRFVVRRTLLVGKKQTYFMLAFVLLLAFAFCRYLLESFVFPPETQLGIFKSSPIRPAFFVITVGIVGIISTMLLYLEYLADKEKLLLQTINAGNEARLQQLQSQINPHFLFNALNNIYSLVLTGSPKAPDMLLHLTELLRYSVYQKQRDKVQVSDEAQQIDFITELFSLRRDEPYNIVFDKQISSGTIEPMILIPLAENCLKHCDFDLNEQAYARMVLVSDNKHLLFETENTYSTTQQKNLTGGVGLANIRERLQLMYGTHATLTTWNEANIYKVKLEIVWPTLPA
jgi:sensor histidine kinase YesM